MKIQLRVSSLFLAPHKTGTIAALCMLYLGAAYHVQSQVITYTMTTVAQSARPFGINNLGQVTGWSMSGEALLYSGGVTTHLSSLSSQSRGFALNNVGQIVGDYGTNLTWGGDYHAFSYSSGTMSALSMSPISGVINSGAYGINDTGQIVGVAELANGVTRAFTYSAGVADLLPSLGGSFSIASAINNSGQIVGGSQTSDGYMHPFLYSNGVLQDLLPSGPNATWNSVSDVTNSQAEAVNDSGQVVGQALTTALTRHAFLWDNGVMTDLGTLGGSESYAYGINAAGDVTGFSQTSNGELHPFIWSPRLFGDDNMRDLNNLLAPSYAGPALIRAFGINDSGQIIVENTAQDAFVLTLNQSGPGTGSVPDTPSTLCLLALSFVGLLFMRRRVVST